MTDVLIGSLPTITKSHGGKVSAESKTFEHKRVPTHVSKSSYYFYMLL